MIDLQSENLIPLNEVPKLLPPRNGKRAHLATVYRWVQHGHKGVKLETLRLPGSTMTSVEAVQRFLERMTAAREGAPIPMRTTRQREAAMNRARKELDAMRSH